MIFKVTYYKILNLIRNLYNKLIPINLKQKKIYLKSHSLSFIGNVMDDCYKDYTKLKNNLQNLHYKKNEIYFLHQIFKKLGVRSNLIDDEYWKNFILLSCLFDKKKYDELNDHLISQIKNSNFDSMEYWELLRIYSFSIRIGLFELGFFLRNQAIKQSLEYGLNLVSGKTWRLKAKLSALLESENFDDFDKLFPLLRKRKKVEKFLRLFTSVRSWWTKEERSLSILRDIMIKYHHNENKEILINIDTQEDLIFRKFIKGKKISIVGPAFTNKSDIEKINEADVVIRINYTKEQVNSNYDKKEIRCDINYFNTVNTLNILKNKIKPYFQNNSWIINKNSSDSNKIKSKLNLEDMNSVNFRTINMLNLGLFSGHLMLMPNIVLDLARFDPGKITIFHSDLYLTKKVKKNYNFYSENVHASKLVSAFAKNHDPITQYKILNFFWKNNFIEGDDRFEMIMQMGVKNYMLEFKKIHRIIPTP